MDIKKQAITIETGTLFRVLIFVLGAYAAFELRGLIVLVLAAVVVASVIEPGTRWFMRRRLPRPTAVVIMYLIVLGLVVSFFTFILPPLFSETITALNGLPKSVKTAELISAKGNLSSIRNLFPDLPSSISLGDISSIVVNAISNFSGGVFDTVSGFVGGVIGLVLIIVVSFYLAVREDGVGEFLDIIVPIRYEKHVKDLWRRTQNKIGRWMQGQLVLALIVGFLTYAGLALLGMVFTDIPHPLLLAFVAAFFELIPVVGLVLAAVPAFLFATLDGGLGLGLIVIALYLIIQQIESHVIYPLVVRKIIGVPPLLVILSLVAGAQLAGIIGALLSVPVAVAIVEILADVERRKRVSMISASIAEPIPDEVFRGDITTNEI
ncbi:MAG: AI-2E family transporter [bacterium]